MLKKATYYFLLIIFFFYLSTSFCNEIPFKSEVELNNWISFYYLKPEPEKIGDAIKYFCNSSMFKKPNSRIYVASFIADLFIKDSKLIENFFKDVSLSGTDNEKIFTLLILQLINTEKSQELLNKLKVQFLK